MNTKEQEQYLNEKVNPIMVELYQQMQQGQPVDHVDFMLNVLKEKRDQLSGLNPSPKAQPQKRFHKFFDKLDSNKLKAPFRPIANIGVTEPPSLPNPPISPNFFEMLNKVEAPTLKELMRKSFFQPKPKEGKQPESANDTKNLFEKLMSNKRDNSNSLSRQKHSTSKENEVATKLIDPAKYSLLARLGHNLPFDANPRDRKGSNLEAMNSQINVLDQVIEDINADHFRAQYGNNVVIKNSNDPKEQGPESKNDTNENVSIFQNYSKVDSSKAILKPELSNRMEDSPVNDQSKANFGSRASGDFEDDESNHFLQKEISVSESIQMTNSQHIDNNFRKNTDDEKSVLGKSEDQNEQSIHTINDSKLESKDRTNDDDQSFNGDQKNTKYYLGELKDAINISQAQFTKNESQSEVSSNDLPQKDNRKTINKSQIGDREPLLETAEQRKEGEIRPPIMNTIPHQSGLKKGSIDAPVINEPIEDSENQSERQSNPSELDYQSYENANLKKPKYKIKAKDPRFLRSKRTSGNLDEGKDDEKLAKDKNGKENFLVRSKKYSKLLNYDFAGGEKINEKLEDGLIVIKLVFGRNFHVTESNKAKVYYVVIDLPDHKRLISKKSKGTDSPNFAQLMTSQTAVTSKQNQFITIKVYEKSNRLFKVEDSIGFIKIPFDDCLKTPNQWRINGLYPLCGNASMQRIFSKSYLGEVYVQMLYCEATTDSANYMKTIPPPKAQLESLIKYPNTVAGIIVFKISSFKDILIFGRKPQNKFSFAGVNLYCTCKFAEHTFTSEKKKFELANTKLDQEFQLKIALTSYSAECLRIELYAENSENNKKLVGFCEILFDSLLRNPNTISDQLYSIINNNEHGNRRVGDMYLTMKYFQGIKKDLALSYDTKSHIFKSKPTYMMIKLLAVEKVPHEKKFYISSKVKFSVGNEEVISKSVKNEPCPIFKQDFVMVIDLNAPEKDKELKVQLLNGKDIISERNLQISDYLTNKNAWNSIELQMIDTCRLFFEILILDNAVIENEKILNLPPSNTKEEIFQPLIELNELYSKTEIMGRLRVNILKAKDLLHPEGKMDEKVSSYIQIVFPNGSMANTKAQLDTFDPHFNEGFYEDLIIKLLDFKYFEVSAHRLEDAKFLGYAKIDCGKLLKSPRTWAVDHYYDLFEKEENLNHDENLISLGKIEVQSMWIPIGYADPGSKYDPLTKDDGDE